MVNSTTWIYCNTWEAQTGGIHTYRVIHSLSQFLIFIPRWIHKTQQENTYRTTQCPFNLTFMTTWTILLEKVFPVSVLLPKTCKQTLKSMEFPFNNCCNQAVVFLRLWAPRTFTNASRAALKCSFSAENRGNKSRTHWSGYTFGSCSGKGQWERIDPAHRVEQDLLSALHHGILVSERDWHYIFVLSSEMCQKAGVTCLHTLYILCNTVWKHSSLSCVEPLRFRLCWMILLLVMQMMVIPKSHFSYPW